jgi:UDP-N-acetylglucosamine 3-dehydrogenase
VTRVGVVGTGVMGRNHARVLREMRDVELVGVADSNLDAASQVAGFHATRGYGSLEELLKKEKPEAVTIAVPTENHHRAVMEALAAGCHVMVEKPIAATLGEAGELVAAARSANRVLAVGHIERYNPAVLELKRRLDEGQLGRAYQFDAQRLGPFPQRIRDVGVVIDLATHDLDLMRFLTGSEIVRVYAETRRKVHTTREDMVSGLVRLADGSVGLLQINWLTPTKIRQMTVTGERGMFRADYLTQDLYFYENAEATAHNWEQITMLRGVSEGSMVKYVVHKREPLQSELEAFMKAVAGDPAGIVSGEDGSEALRLALALVESGDDGRVVTVART